MVTRALPLFAFALVASCGGIPPHVVIDETAAPRDGVVGCADGLGALTYAQRLRVERVVDDVATHLATSGLMSLQVRIVCAEDTDALARTANGKVILSVELVRWLFDDWAGEVAGDERLAFVIGHEVGHLLTPACDDPCAAAFACEQRADEIALEISGVLGRLAMSQLALRTHARLTDASDERACLAYAEVELRHASAVERRARTGGTRWEDRRDWLRSLTTTSETRAKVRTHLDRCSALIERLPDEADRTCLQDRVVALRTVLDGGLEVHDVRDPRLQSQVSRWHDDARFQVALEMVPSWLVSLSDPPEMTLDPRIDEQVWMPRLFVGYEGGSDASYGLRLGAATGRYSGQLAAEGALAFPARWLAVGFSFGFGVIVYRDTRDATGFVADGGVRFIARLRPRLHLATGIELGADNIDEQLRIAVPLTLSVHLGRY